MPKITFFNLADDKRQLLIEALEQEFSRVPLYNASISNIVKSANIPRGSFYQYFEDKEDAYFFLLKEQLIRNKENFIFSLQKCNGDLFDTMTELYGLTIRELSKGENINFLKNVFLNMTHEIENKFNEVFHADGDIEHFKKISLLIKRDDLNVADDKELFHLMKIIITITLRNLIEKFAENLSEKEAMNNYLIEIELLKKGLKKI